jgi:hypothetical protein
MSVANIRAALETALLTISPSISSAFENVPFTPVVGTPYQHVTLLTADPDNPEFGSGYMERGIFQVSLFYPIGEGAAAATARAALIRAKFVRGASFSAGGTTTTIERTPSVGPGRIEDDRYFLPVKVRFYSHVRS